MSRGRLQVWEETKEYESFVLNQRASACLTQEEPVKYSLQGWQVYRGREWTVLGEPLKVEFEQVKYSEVERFRALFAFADGVSRNRSLSKAECLMLAASSEGIVEFASILALQLPTPSRAEYGHFAPEQYGAFFLRASNISLEKQQGIYVHAFPLSSQFVSETSYTEAVWPRIVSRGILYQLEAKLISEVNDSLKMQ